MMKTIIQNRRKWNGSKNGGIERNGDRKNSREQMWWKRCLK